MVLGCFGSVKEINEGGIFQSIKTLQRKSNQPTTLPNPFTTNAEPPMSIICQATGFGRDPPQSATLTLRVKPPGRRSLFEKKDLSCAFKNFEGNAASSLPRGKLEEPVSKRTCQEVPSMTRVANGRTAIH